MKKKPLLLVGLLLLLSSAGADDLKKEIGKQSDAVWDYQLSALKKEGNLVPSNVDTKTIAGDFDTYLGKFMLFPGFSFDDVVTDRDGVRYFYYGEPEGNNFFVIKYNAKITEQLRKYSYAIGPVGDDGWELLGTIKDVFGWWGNIVLMDIRAVRIKGMAAIVLEGEELSFVAEKLIDKLMDTKAKAGLGDVPKNLSKIPSGLDPMTIANLYIHLANVEKNRDVWLQLLAESNSRGGKPDVKVSTWWNNLTRDNRTFFYVRTAIDDAAEKKYFYQIQNNGENVGSPKPLNLVLEAGEWKIRSGL